jgi:hypothetical protein
VKINVTPRIILIPMATVGQRPVTGGSDHGCCFYEESTT